MTLWATYGPYHVARVNALSEAFGAPVVPVSFCRTDGNYSFFDRTVEGQIRLSDGDLSEIRPWQAFRAARRAVLDHRPDLILACGYERPESWGALWAARETGAPCLLMFDNRADDSPRRRIKESVKAWVVGRFDGYVYAGPHNAAYLRRLGIAPGREVDGYDCIDNAQFARWAEKWRCAASPHARPYLLCVARLVPKKNLLRLIDAHDRWCRTASAPWDLVLIGDGPQHAQLQARIAASAEQRPADVTLVGAEADPSQVARWYAHAEGLILPSDHNEQWGLVVNEAMACGLPVLVSEQSGCASSLVEDGRNGRSFDAMRTEAIAEAIDWLHQQGEGLQLMGKRSRQVIERFSPAEFARKVAQLYRQVGAQRPAPADARG